MLCQFIEVYFNSIKVRLKHNKMLVDEVIDNFNSIKVRLKRSSAPFLSMKFHISIP